MESIELQTKPRNLSRSNGKKYINDFPNNNPSPIIKNFDPYIANSSNNSYKNDYLDNPNFTNRNRSKSSRQTYSKKKNSKISENNISCKISEFNTNLNFQNKSNINNNQKDSFAANSSRSTDNFLFEEKTNLNASANYNNNNINNKQEQESLINLSCEALYYYLKEKGLLSNSRILLLTVIVYLLVMITHSMNYTFLLFSKPIYLSYKYECISPKTKTIMPCTSRNVCFCEDLGRCVTMTWASDVIGDPRLNNTYYFGDKTFISKTSSELKFKFGEISNFYIYDYKGKISDSLEKSVNASVALSTQILDVLNSSTITVNYNYKKKDKFCLMILNCFILCVIFNCGSFTSELVFGYLSDYIGKYIIINILSVVFAVNQIIYFFLFHHLEEINEKDYSNFIWGIFAFFLGASTTPLKNFIICFYLELFPSKDELFSANGLIQSATSFSFILNFLFFIKLKQIKYIFVFYFAIVLAFIFVFMKYFRENPRFYSETRNISNEMLNIELKKLAVMQIMDTRKIQNPLLDTINNTNNEKLNFSEGKKTLNRKNESIGVKNSKEDLIFKKDEIEKKIKEINKINKKNTKKMNMKKGALEDLKTNKSRKCPCDFFSFFSNKKNKNDNSDDYKNELVRRNTFLNKSAKTIKASSVARQRVKAEGYVFSRKSLQSSNNNPKMSRRHGRISKDISGQDMDTLTKDLISHSYDNDLYIKKYIFTYSLVKLSFSICYTSQYFYIHNKITDPNSDNEYRSFSFLFNIFVLTNLVHVLAGKFSFFINSRTLNIICLVIFGFIMIFVDSDLILITTQKNLYYGEERVFFKTNTSSWMRIFGVITISVVNSLFEISVISYPPTLYRGKVMMKINLLANFSAFVSFIAIFLIDTWAIYIGILALIVLFLYFTRLNDYNLEILESKDEAYIAQIKMYINKRFSKINIVDKVDKNY